MKVMAPTWTPIPGHPDYDLGPGTHPAVRSRKRAKPIILRPTQWHGFAYYCLDGRSRRLVDLVELVRGTQAVAPVFGLEERQLTGQELREIREAEGFKPAFDVADEFHIDSSRVRRIWNGNPQ